VAEYVELTISEALQVFEGLNLTDREAIIAERILREIQERLRFLHDVGVGYLTLGRSAATLSGGEGQRIRLATQIGANLTGVLYVLDEPSIGLHQRDNRKLLATLARLRDLGNTSSSSSDEETIRTADYVIDLGPGAGELGGHVIFQGRPRISSVTDRTSSSVAHRRLSARARFRRRRRAARVEGRAGHQGRARTT
jgi:excinuclease ABC subunit A